MGQIRRENSQKMTKNVIKVCQNGHVDAGLRLDIEAFWPKRLFPCFVSFIETWPILKGFETVFTRNLGILAIF